jgi:site-specific recombinase XerD
LVRLASGAQDYATAARRPATLKAYESDWRHFDEWCERHGVPSMPAYPDVVAKYVTDLASTMKSSTITRRLASISIAHQAVGFPSPTHDIAVRTVARGVRRTLGTATREAAPLLIGDLRRVIAHLPDTLAGTRDRALLLVGWAGALRRSELVALDAEDLTTRDEGLVATIRRSKTDPEGAGRSVALPHGHDPHTCPVRALHGWQTAAGITSGPIFRPINRHGQVGPQRLTAQSVTDILRRAAHSANIEQSRLSGHSLRAGFATSAAAAGATERAIANQTGHRSMDVLRKYIRIGTIFTDNAVSQVGL